MAYVQIEKETAKRFVKFLLDSKAWTEAPAGQWEAFRLTKTRKTRDEEPWHSPLDVLVIHKNKKGIHSFDPLHMRAYEEYMKSGVTDCLSLVTGAVRPPNPARDYMETELARIREILAQASTEAELKSVNIKGSEAEVTFVYKLPDFMPNS